MNQRTSKPGPPGLSPHAPLPAGVGTPAWDVPVAGEGCLLLLCDRSGIVRGLGGTAGLLARARYSGLAPGTDLGEASAGTNAVGLAQLGQPCPTVQAEGHSQPALRAWSARARAVHLGERLVGYASVWWPARPAPEPALLELALQLAETACRENVARSESAWLLKILEGATDPVRGHLLVDAAGTVLLASPAACRFLGVRQFRDLSLDLPFLWQQLERHRSDGAQFTLRPPAVASACAVSVRQLPGEPGLTSVGVELLLTGAPTRGQAFAARCRFEDIITVSANMRQALAVARSAAATDTPILLLGESGTGKELVAQAVHQASPRSARPFVAVNCAAFPRDLIVSELFGYEDGAFTGARRQGAPGRFEQADGGTLFLDEIGEMTPEHQAMLLRVLEDGIVVRLGGGKPRPVNVRVVAATNQELKRLVEEGRFRADLYYRLNIIPVHLPPLRQRPDDIAALVQQFSEREGRGPDQSLTWTPQALAEMRHYPWPGNVRELYNVVKRAAALAAGGRVSLEALPWLDAPGAAAPHRRRLRSQDVAAALTAAEGNVAEAARRLGVARSSIYRLQQRAAAPPAGSDQAGPSLAPAALRREAGAEPSGKLPSTGARKGRSR